jgi:hypothetical protein
MRLVSTACHSLRQENLTYICDGSLGGVVPHQPGSRAVRTNRSDVNHRTLCTLLFDLCGKDVTSEKDAFDVDAHDLVKLFLSDEIGALQTTTSTISILSFVALNVPYSHS